MTSRVPTRRWAAPVRRFVVTTTTALITLARPTTPRSGRSATRRCRSFARDAPTRGLTQRHHTENVSNADYVRAAGLPTMRPVQIKRYARSLAPI